MSDLTYIEKATIENFLGMKSGYVMDFSDRTFHEFVGEPQGLILIQRNIIALQIQKLIDLEVL